MPLHMIHLQASASATPGMWATELVSGLIFKLKSMLRVLTKKINCTGITLPSFTVMMNEILISFQVEQLASVESLATTWLATCIGSKVGHQVVPLALLHCLGSTS